MTELPGPLRLEPSFPFVGRATELATLRALVPGTTRDGLQVALVAGEAGSGKSRLTRELANEVAAGGVMTLYGACDGVVSAPYQPFVEALAHLVAEGDQAQLREGIGTFGADLARLLPELAPPDGDESAPPLTSDPDAARHRLHLAVTQLLTVVARRTPLLLVLEDLHWADASTLHLLRHLARAGADARILLVATFREGADAGAELTAALADLARAEGVVRIRLGGLGSEEVAELVGRMAGGADAREAAAVAGEISELTEGNPFLVGELWRALVESDLLSVEPGRLRLIRPVADLTTTEGVRDVVDQRLGRLRASTRELLELAAALGPEFELRVLASAAALDDSELGDALDEAVRSAMIQELPPLGLLYRFNHELVRHALSDGLTGVRRAELHLRVGEALEQIHGGDSTAVLLALAHHFAIASPIDGAGRGAEYNVRAGDAALTALAYEEAARCYRAATRHRRGGRAPPGGGAARARAGAQPGRCSAGGSRLPARRGRHRTRAP